MNSCIMIPTFNERENIVALLEAVLAEVPDSHVLVVDDDSPDRTWELVEELMRREPRVYMLRRIGERGRGTAMVAGFKWALDRGAASIVEMDADFSHQPSRVRALLEELESCDVVLGSRFVPGGTDCDRGRLRRAVSRFARWYLRLLFGYRVSDPTSGFRCFSAEALEKMDFRNMRSVGAFAVTESLSRCHRAGLRIHEVPIEFIDRKKGMSKMGGGMLLRYLFQAFRQALAVRIWRP